MSRGPRLATLLKSFGLCPIEVAKQERKTNIVSLKTAYKQMAKEHHPDKAAEGEQAEATRRFTELATDFEEALKMLESGIRPGQAPGGTSGPSAGMPGAGPTYEDRRWEYHAQFKHRAPDRFDLQTRIKGNLIFWTSFFGFLVGLREFLVWSAGSTYAWNRPATMSISEVRRYKGNWTEDVEERAKESAAKEEPPKVKEMASKKDRGVSSFYQRRGVSNARRSSKPRGFGRDEI